MRKIFKFLILNFYANKALYLAAAGAFALGMMLGTVFGKNFSDAKYLSDFFGGLSAFSDTSLLFRAFSSAFLISAAIGVFGLSPVGIAAVPVIDGFRGFSLAFSAAAFYNVYGLKSVVFILVALVIPTFLWLPPLLFASVSSVKCSLSIAGICRRKAAPDFSSNVRSMLLSCLLVFVFVLLSRLCEIYIIPAILNVVCGLYI